jgi:uncharacterized protein (TIGR03067 family)
MRKLILLLVCLFASLLGCVPAPSRAKYQTAEEEELAKFEGTWKMVSYKSNGVEYSAAHVNRKPTVTFYGSSYFWSNGMQPGKIVNLGLTKTPKTIDYQYSEGADKNKIYLAIYEIDGDTLKDCFDPTGRERPKEFVSKAGSGHTLVTYKRIK